MSAPQRKNPSLISLAAVTWLLAAVVYFPEKLSTLPSRSSPTPAAEAPQDKEELRDAVAMTPPPPAAALPRLTVLHAPPPPRRAALRAPVRPRPARTPGLKRRAAEPPAALAVPEGSYVVQGRIVDIRTLKPVTGTKVRFKDGGTGNIVSVTTDERGRYRAALRSNRYGYLLTIRREGYLHRAVSDWTSPGAASQRSDTIVLSTPGQTITQDLALVPNFRNP